MAWRCLNCLGKTWTVHTPHTTEKGTELSENRGSGFDLGVCIDRTNPLCPVSFSQRLFSEESPVLPTVSPRTPPTPAVATGDVSCDTPAARAVNFDWNRERRSSWLVEM